MLQNEGMEIGTVFTIFYFAVLCEMPLILFSKRFMDRICTKTLIPDILEYGSGSVSLLWSASLHLQLPIQILMTLFVKHPSGMLSIMINVKVVSSLVDKRYQGSCWIMPVMRNCYGFF